MMFDQNNCKQKKIKKQTFVYYILCIFAYLARCYYGTKFTYSHANPKRVSKWQHILPVALA